jgi:hypothetical protein
MGYSDAGTLDPPAHPPEQATEVVLPVGASPDLVPVDDYAIAAALPEKTRGRKSEKRRCGRMHDVVAAALAEQMPQDAEPEAHGRPDPAPTTGCVELETRPHSDNVHTGHACVLVLRPLAECEVRDMVPRLGEPLAEVSVPPFGAAHGVGVEAVVDEADMHVLEGNCEAWTETDERRSLPPYNARSVSEVDKLPPKRRVAIVPALNESATIGRVIQEIRAADPGFEVVVVDDGSDDGTGALAEAAGARLLILPFNLGIGGAVQTGFRYALANGFDIAVQIDGDGQHDPSQLRVILEPLIAGEADMVIGSRYAGIGTYRARGMRRLGQRLFASIVSLLVRQPLTDTSSSFRALNRRSLSLFAADYPHGFLETVEATVLAGKYRLRIREVPVIMRERETGSTSLTVPLSLFYSAKVLLAVFVSIFRRPALRLEEEP